MDRANGAARGWLAGGGALIAIAAPALALLAGCAQIRTTSADLYEATHMQPLAIDPSSPVAEDAARAEQVNAPIPKFSAVPPKPTDIRTAAAYKTQVLDVVGDKRELTRWEAAHPPGVVDTEGFAEGQRSRLANETPVSAAKQADAEAFAKRLREAAQAPPPKPAAKTETPAKSAPSPY